jgi:wyosine [tRNA(Phe)-imidazoG37] synthetase (radical SAM superfamily)
MDNFVQNKKTVYGPIKSRRLGISLGINLLPTNIKHCTFNCIYCECGKTIKNKVVEFPIIENFEKELQVAAENMAKQSIIPDSISFAGNGEACLHPDFPLFMEQTFTFRNKFFPNTQISVFSNASMLHDKTIIESLKRADQLLLKLDCGTESCFQAINQPQKAYSLNVMHSKIKSFSGEIIIQSMFIRANINGIIIDNTGDKEINEWIARLEDIHPKKVMLCSIDREPACKEVEVVDIKELETIANKLRKAGMQASVY